METAIVATDIYLLNQAYQRIILDPSPGNKRRIKAIKYVIANRKIYTPILNKVERAKNR